MLKVEHTTRSYSGKRGCMCGCNGDYSEAERTRKLAITQLLKNPAVRLQSWSTHADGVAGCIFVETDTRNRVLFLTPAGVLEAQLLGIKEEE